jgi:hypothetical protein
MTCFDIQLAHQMNSNHMLTRNTFVNIVIITLLNLCYSIMSHTTLILYYHVNIANLSNLMCTLVAMYA